VLKAGFLEDLLARLQPQDYGVGGVAYINRDGFDIPYGYGAISYLHPPCMLCNIEVMRQWPLPIKHGAPMTAPMLALHDAGRSELVRHVDWTLNDVTPDTPKLYLDHIGRGTVTHTQGYHLEEWMAEVQQKQQAAPAPVPQAQGFNASLLALIPQSAKALLEIGCSTGGLAQALKKQRPGIHFMGLELDPKAAEMARRHCDDVATFDIEQADASHYRRYADRDCWIFGDVLEHLRDPWRVLSEIRKVLPPGACIVASIPNAQHWSVQARLTMGEFRYESTGLLDRTHLRWFTRITIFELFQSAGLRVEAGMPCIYQEPPIRERVLEGIRQMAVAVGRDPEGAVRDALPVQYVVRAVSA
jgi:SAM-dependent methyltransferase